MSRHSCSTAGTVAHTAIPCTRSETLLSRSTPLSRTAHSSAVRRSSVATRQWSSTSPSSTSPTTVWELPMSAQSRVIAGSPQVHPDVEDDHRVGQGADGDEVDSGAGDVAGPVEGQPAGGLEGGVRRMTGGDRDRLGHLRVGHVVEQDLLAAGLEELAQLLEVGHLDLHGKVRVGRPHGLERREHTTGSDHVVVLDHGEVAEAEAMVDAATAAD